MIKRTFYFGNPAYFGMKNFQLEIRLPQTEKNDSLSVPFKENFISTIPIEDIGVAVIDHQQRNCYNIPGDLLKLCFLCQSYI